MMDIPCGHEESMPLADALSAAARLGETEGKREAGWVFDGNTSRERYAQVLKWITDGDPQVDSIMGLSWCAREVFDRLDLDYDHTALADQDLIMDAFREPAEQAFWAEVERTARYHLEGS